MKNILSHLLTLLIGFTCIAQTSVDFSNLVFERTENKSVVYSQYAAKTELSAKTISDQRIELDLGAGSAEVVQSNDNILRAEAEIIISVKNEKKIVEALEDLDLYIDEDGGKVELVSRFDYKENENNVNTGFFSSPERRIDIKIYVPKDLELKLNDRSGDLEINDISNNLRLTDASGAIRINGLEGNLNLRDNSGEIVIKNVNREAPEAMTVKIRDASGGIYLSNVNGDTEIEDTSGEIDVSKIGGSLTIDDTSGGIRVKDVKGDSRVVDTSGEISLVSIDGNVTISDTSGGIYVDTVTKNVTLKRDGSGSFTTKNIKGDITDRG